MPFLASSPSPIVAAAAAESSWPSEEVEEGAVVGASSPSAGGDSAEEEEGAPEGGESSEAGALDGSASCEGEEEACQEDRSPAWNKKRCSKKEEVQQGVESMKT